MLINYDDFEYEIDNDEVYDAIEEVLNTYSKDKVIKLLLNELDIQTELEEYFYDDIKDYYEEEAWENHHEIESYKKDPLGYVGMSQKDFI